MILEKRLRKEVEKKKIMLQNQTGFSKRLGTMENVYVLNYLINRQLGKKKRMLVTLFVDEGSF